MKKTALVICPGRGTYNAPELGYLYRHHSGKTALISQLDALREANGQVTLSALDQAESFKSGLHMTGDNASLLIYGCAMADFQTLNRGAFDIVAVTGNSMGWYLALAAAGAVSFEGGAQIVNTMGQIMHDKAEGGQIVYPVTDKDWRVSTAKLAQIEQVLNLAPEDAVISTSIRLGGLIVFAANRKGLSYLQKALPKDDRFPMRLAHHGAFHSPLLDDIVPMAKAALPQSLFTQPDIPMIDGQGNIWRSGSAELEKLYHYTLGAQIKSTFDFSKAVEVGVKEYAPDVIIILGPGSTLGGPTAQELIKHQWEGLASKADFKQRQSDNPYIISMNIAEQRALAV
jgi:malonyl CoA-acyl carrier protein transacylase